MSKPRTAAQRNADYKKTFPKKVNDRRLELIHKKHSGFTTEESSRPYADHPGWKEECERRHLANLTDAEQAELAECTRIVDEWSAKSPWWIDREEYQREQMAELDELIRRVKAKKMAEPPPPSPTAEGSRQ